MALYRSKEVPERLLGSKNKLLFFLFVLSQLHAVATDETDNKLLQLYTYENYRKPGRVFDTMYHENAQALLHDQNIYRIEYSFSKTCLSIQLMNSANDQLEVAAITMEPGFANYLQNDFLSSVNDEEKSGVYLKRNKAKVIGTDESSGISNAMKGLKSINEIESNMAGTSSKVKYVRGREDLLYRSKQKNPELNSNAEIWRNRSALRFRESLKGRFDALP